MEKTSKYDNTTIYADRTVAQTTRALVCDFNQNKYLIKSPLCYHHLFNLAKGVSVCKAGKRSQTYETRVRENSLKIKPTHTLDTPLPLADN